MRVSVELLPDASADEVLSAIDVADASDIDTVFCVDEIYHRDAWGLLAAAAPRVPLVIGAMGGPLTFRLAGEVGDGVYAALLAVARGAAVRAREREGRRRARRSGSRGSGDVRVGHRRRRGGR